MTKALPALLVMCVLSACASGGGLRDLRSSGAGPDEFSVLPVNPLTMPEDRSTLPPPTPGARNRVDPTPVADAITALGGRPSAVFAGGVPARDSALIAAAGRYGVPAGIRETVTAEDTALRRGAGRIGGLFGRGDRYFRLYGRQALDAYAELARLRAAGIETPTAPPVK